MVYKLELTEEELNFIYDRCSNKAARLEEVNLKDTPCYRLAHQVMHKIYDIKKEDNDIKELFKKTGIKKKEEVINGINYW